MNALLQFAPLIVVVIVVAAYWFFVVRKKTAAKSKVVNALFTGETNYDAEPAAINENTFRSDPRMQSMYYLERLQAFSVAGENKEAMSTCDLLRSELFDLTDFDPKTETDTVKPLDPKFAVPNKTT
jgi:hypothetical protein